MRILTEILKHPANSEMPVRALVQAFQWQLSKRLSGKPLDLSYHGLKLRCYPNNHSASRAIYFSGLPDYHEMNFMLDYLRPGDRFIDAGANIGLYTLLARSIVGEDGGVDAFEPNLPTAIMLLENIDLNKLENVRVHQLGLAETAGQVNFDLTTDDCTAHIIRSEPNQILTEQQIETVRLDEYLEDVPYAMAKFDIEGYEPFAVQGTSRWLKKGNPAVMLLEVAGYSKQYGITSSDFIQQLNQLGYFIAIYDSKTKALVETNCPWEYKVDNVLAIFEGSQGLVNDRLRASRQ